MENNFNFESSYFADKYNLFLIEQKGRSIEEIADKLAKKGVAVINLGNELAKKIKKLNNTKYIIVDAPNLLRELFDKHNVITPNIYKPAIAIYNLGILLEPTLSLAATNILGNISKDKVIIVIWNYLIKDGKVLYWTDESFNYYNFDFSDYNLKILEI